MPGTRRSAPMRPASPSKAHPTTAPTRVTNSASLRPSAARNVPATRTSRLMPRLPQRSPTSRPVSVRNRSGTGVTPQLRSSVSTRSPFAGMTQIRFGGSGPRAPSQPLQRLPGSRDLRGNCTHEAIDTRHRELQSVLVEQEGRGVRKLMRRPVERVGARGRVQRVADGDLVRARRTREARVQAHVQAQAGELFPQPGRLETAALRQVDFLGRIAVDAALEIEDGFAVPSEDEKTQ